MENYNEFINSTAADYAAMLEAIAVNSITVDGLPGDTPPSFIVRELLERGRVGYIPAPDGIRGWYRVNPTEFRAPHSDEATRAQFGTSWGAVVATLPLFPFFKDDHATPYGVVIRANARSYPVYGDIVRTANMCAAIDAAILSNLQTASNAPIVTASEDTAKSIKKALNTRGVFAPYLVVSEAIGEALTKSVNIASPYIADKLNDLHGARWAAQLRRLGVAGQSEYKRERVQTAEVNAGIGEVIDWVYTTIDTANSDAQRAGVPVKFRFNGFSEKYDTSAQADVEGVENDE